MKLMTDAQRTKLLRNGRAGETGDDELAMKPVVKLFDPNGGATWLLVSLYPENPDLAFGLTDLGLGFPELGDIYLPELGRYRGKFGLGIERDLYFDASKTLGEYAERALEAGRVEA